MTIAGVLSQAVKRGSATRGSGKPPKSPMNDTVVPSSRLRVDTKDFWSRLRCSGDAESG